MIYHSLRLIGMLSQFIALSLFLHSCVTTNDKRIENQEIIDFPICLSTSIQDAILSHVEYERQSGYINYPDSVLIASIWFDSRQDVDSVYVMGYPMALYPEETDCFLGYYQKNGVFLCFSTIADAPVSHLNEFLDVSLLNTNPEEYKKVVDNLLLEYLSDELICSSIMSSYYVDDCNRLVLSQRRIHR
ncbi:MAG: hypothetical protein IJ651_08790 [Bacteroidales bacterium]|nr:hypothetical protein [Bacteroidales bacterium]